MWIDERGSEVLELPECRRLLSFGAKIGLHGHLGINESPSPLVLPVNYGVAGHDVVINVGEGIFGKVGHANMVAFQVDGVEGDRYWSVLVRGLAIEVDEDEIRREVSHLQIATPGRRFVRIRSDVVTGRRLAPSDSGSSRPDSAIQGAGFQKGNRA